MPQPPYSYTGPIDCPGSVSNKGLEGRSAIVTGGASGLGAAYTEALVNAGVFVTIGDINEELASQVVKKYPGKVHFSKCDVTSWEDQVKLFKSAIENSPSKSCDIVLANAGVSGIDDVFKLEDPNDEPVKPNLHIVNINVNGVLYTAKLAMHYFRKQPVDESRDRLLILQGSMAGYVDQPGTPQYAASKYALRGMMKSLRRTVGQQDMRVNFIGPWFIKTPIMSDKVIETLISKGINFAKAEDACKALLRFATDKSVNGRALMIVPREDVPAGYMDPALDDYTSDDDPFKYWQTAIIKASHRVAESSALQIK